MGPTDPETPRLPETLRRSSRPVSTSRRLGGSASRPSSPVEQLVDEALAPASAVDEEVLQLDESRRWIASWLLCQPVAALTSRRLKRRSSRTTPCFSQRDVTRSSRWTRSRRVCGGSSSRLRPRTSEARRLARATSASVASTYSTISPSAVQALHFPLVLEEEGDGLDELEV
jgi:hypothetical protein